MNRMEMDTRTLTKAASGPALPWVLCIWLWGRQRARLGTARMSVVERIVQAEGTPCREPRRTDGGGNEREKRGKEQEE